MRSRRRQLGWSLLLGIAIALLATAPAQAVRITEYSDGIGARGLVAGPDGKLWGTRVVDDEGRNLRTDYVRVDPAGPTLLSSFSNPGYLSEDIVRAGGRVFGADRPQAENAVIAEVGYSGLSRLTQPGMIPMQFGFAGAPDGSVWVGRTFNYLDPARSQPLLSRFDPGTRRFADLPLPRRGGVHGVAGTIAVGGDGAVWFDERLPMQPDGTGGYVEPKRVNRLDPRTGALSGVDLPGEVSLQAGAVARDGAFWFVGQADPNRPSWLVGRVAPDGKSLQTRFPPFDVGFLMGITVGPDGALWAPMRTGLARIDPATFAMQEIVYPTVGDRGGLVARITTLGNQIWTGSEHNLVRLELDKNGTATGDLAGAQRGGVTAPVACTTACTASAEVLARPRGRARLAGISRRRRAVRLGRTKLRSPTALRKTEIVRLSRSRRVRRYLRRNRTLSVRVRVRIREGRRTRTTTRRFVLRKRGLKKPRRRR